VSRPDYFFIVGCPRSGTTLLSVLLDRHSRLCVPPETAFFDEVAPRLGRGDHERLLKVLGHWPRLPELALRAESVVQRLAGRPAAPAAVLAAMLDLYAEARGKARCGEKTPQHLKHVPAILRGFPRARIVCLLRDGRDTALSLRSMPWWSGSLAAAAGLWKQYVRLAEDFAGRHPARFTIVRYEDLVSRPEGVLSAVMAYIGETLEPGQLRPDLPSGVVLPRSMPWKGRALGSIEAERIGERYRQATPDERVLLERTLHDELSRYGYVTG